MNVEEQICDEVLKFWDKSGVREMLRRIDRKFCDIDQQREYNEIQEDLRRAYEQGGNINVRLHYDRG